RWIGENSFGEIENVDAASQKLELRQIWLQRGETFEVVMPDPGAIAVILTALWLYILGLGRGRMRLSRPPAGRGAGL
ncbi:MAG: hypothetical protein WBE25_08245, partial [Xanthobacteraceae bacterium]